MKKLYLNENWLYKKYIIEKLSSYEIANICQVDSTTISNWMRKFNIKARTLSEAREGKYYGKENHFFGKHHSDESKKKMRKKAMGWKFSKETRKKLSRAHRGENNHAWGKHPSKEARAKMSKAHKGINAGKNHYNWKGGITPLYIIIRNSNKYKEWREAVFRRDNYTCLMCKKRGGKTYLHPHHLLPFADYPNHRFDIDNGLTLCKDCHKIIHKRYLWLNIYKLAFGGIV